MTGDIEFAILAPVPLVHLQSGVVVCASQGFVAFGSNKWEQFRTIDEIRKDRPVPCLLYASHEGVPGKLAFAVTWFGWYIGHVDSVGGAHPEKMKYRPESTFRYAGGSAGHWAVYWHVTGLRELPKEKHSPIGNLQSHARGTWRKNAPPRGPELVELSQLFADEA